MSHVEPVLSRPGCDSHLCGDRPDVLCEIARPGVNLCVWQRETDPTIAREVARLGARQLADARGPCAAGSFADDVAELLSRQGLDPIEFTHWRADLHSIATLFFKLVPGRKAVLRLETVAGDACRRFHSDHTQLRLLCTYRGPGTEWLHENQVDRAAQANGESNEKILRSGTPSQLAPFWVGIMKGEEYPGNAGRGLVHRSPAMSGCGEARVLFCLDAGATT